MYLLSLFDKLCHCLLRGSSIQDYSRFYVISSLPARGADHGMFDVEALFIRDLVLDFVVLWCRIHGGLRPGTQHWRELLTMVSQFSWVKRLFHATIQNRSEIRSDWTEIANCHSSAE